MVARKRAQNNSASISLAGFTVRDVVAAMEEMYADELKPVSKLLRRRVFDRVNGSQTAGVEVINVDVRGLKAVCIACPLITLEAVDKGDWCALLVGRPCLFVDCSITSDPYSASIWASFKRFFEGPQGCSLNLVGGRTAAAEALRNQNLPDFAGFSLGRLCHIVELALTQKSILGYKNGAIVPYKLSDRAVKEQSALQQRPCAASQQQVATLQVARLCLQQLLQEAPSGSLPLPNVKRLFTARFNIQLSETVFGHSKVSDLLQDSRFQDICTVEFQNGFTVRRKVKTISMFDHLAKDASPFDATVALPCRVQLFCQEEPLLMEEEETLKGHDEPIFLVPSPAPGNLQAPGTPAPCWCLSPNTWSKDGYAGVVKNTFIHAKLPPATPLLRARRRNKTVPSDMGMEQVNCILDDCIADDSTTDSSNSSHASSRDSSPEPKQVQSLQSLMQSSCFDDSCTGCSSTQFASNEMLSLEGDSVGTALSMSATASLTPISSCDFRQNFGCRVPLCSESPLVTEVLAHAASNKTFASCIASTTTGAVKSPVLKPKKQQSVRFDDASSIGATDDLPPAPASKRKALISYPALTPNTLLTKGFVVRGTFLDVLPSLPTPVRRSASHRSRSEPKNMGSDTLCEGSCESGSPDLNVCERGQSSSKYATTTPSMIFPPTPWY